MVVRLLVGRVSAAVTTSIVVSFAFATEHMISSANCVLATFFDVVYITLHLVYLVFRFLNLLFEFLLISLYVFHLFLNHESMVGLQYLLVDKVPPCLRVQLVIEVVYITLCPGHDLL